MLRTVQGIRYVMPFRQGGSVPALVECDDSGMYVVKLRGAAQGPKALVAEVIAGEIARALGLPIPEIVLVDLARELSASEPDPEICGPLEASAGLNLGLDYLPGSITFNPVVGPHPDATMASRLVLFDAFVLNVDRTPRNANLLSWHRKVWLIDHGASLYFHHGWRPKKRLEGKDDPFTEVVQHVALRWASALEEAESHLREALTEEAISRIVGDVPDAFLTEDSGFESADEHRAAYVEWLIARTGMIGTLREEASRGRASGV